ncbi:MAG: hypothetical protein ABIC40_00095 [bacterium]
MSDTLMIYLDNATDSAVEELANFFRDAGIAVEWAATAEGADAVIDWPDDRIVSDPGFLHAGGRIACPDAFAAASKMKIDRIVMGKLLDHLNIRIYSCQLGCFP